MDAVLVGQAFHWFEPERALVEIRRVLRPGGVPALLWNLLDDARDPRDRLSASRARASPQRGLRGPRPRSIGKRGDPGDGA